MKLGDSKPQVGGLLKAGKNQMLLQSWEVLPPNKEGYSGQILFSFILPSKKEDAKPIEKRFYLGLQGKFTEKNKFMLDNKLVAYVDFLAAFVGKAAAQAKFDQCWDKLADVAIDNEDTASVNHVEQLFFENMMEGVDVTEKPVTVVLHYQGKYLNIPTYKENEYKLPIGLNPFMSTSLRFDEEVPEIPEGNTYEEAEAIADAGFPESGDEEDGNLPF